MARKSSDEIAAIVALYEAHRSELGRNPFKALFGICATYLFTIAALWGARPDAIPTGAYALLPLPMWLLIAVMFADLPTWHLRTEAVRRLETDLLDTAGYSNSERRFLGVNAELQYNIDRSRSDGVWRTIPEMALMIIVAGTASLGVGALTLISLARASDAGWGWLGWAALYGTVALLAPIVLVSELLRMRASQNP